MLVWQSPWELDNISKFLLFCSYFTRGPTPRGGPQSQSHSTFLHFHTFTQSMKIWDFHAFHEITHVFEWFYEITHIFQRFHASCTHVDSRNHAEIKSFSRFHATLWGGLLHLTLFTVQKCLAYQEELRFWVFCLFFFTRKEFLLYRMPSWF